MCDQTFLYVVSNRTHAVRIIDIMHKDADLKVFNGVGDTLLHIAFNKEEPNEARVIRSLTILLDRGLDINVKNRVGKTVLHLASERRMKRVIDFCLQRNADPTITDHYGNTIAHFVIEDEFRRFHMNASITLEKESSNFIKWMISKGIDFIHAKNAKNFSALYLANELCLQHILFTLLNYINDWPAVESDQTPLLIAFLEKDTKTNKVNFFRKTLKPIDPLYYNNRYSSQIVETVLGKNKHMSNETMNIVLHLVINSYQRPFYQIDTILERTTTVWHQESGESLLKTFTEKFLERARKWKMQDIMKIIQKLVQKGANINEKDAFGETIAMELFHYHPTFEMLRLLKDCGADFGARTYQGDSFLHLMSQEDIESGLIDLMINESIDINTVNSNGETPLQISIVFNRYFFAKDLLDHGARVDIRNQLGQSALYFAADSPYMTKLLINYGANVNHRDNQGKTPVHWTTNPEVIEILVNAGALVNVLDNEGHSPLFRAMSQANLSLVTELLKRGADIQELEFIKRTLQHFWFPDSAKDKTYLYLMEHLVKLNAVGLLKDIHHADVESEKRVQEFQKECQVEVERLETHYVDDDCTSIYKFLHRKRHRECVYIDNKQLKKLVKDKAIEHMFPNYYVVIMGCYYDAKIRNPLLKKTAEILEKINNVILPELCFDQLLMYLSNIDLWNFVEALECFVN